MRPFERLLRCEENTNGVVLRVSPILSHFASRMRLSLLPSASKISANFPRHYSSDQKPHQYALLLGFPPASVQTATKLNPYKNLSFSGPS